MAHQLTSTDDMAYHGDVPWHGLGNPLPADASLDVWRIAANLDWEIKERSISYADDGDTIFIPNRKALVRSDTREALGIFSDAYKVVQPTEVLEFHRDLIEGDLGFKMETAGTLNGGRKIWSLSRAGDPARIHGNDEVRPYLLCATSYDGSLATTVKFTSVRVVCNNTLTYAYATDRRAADGTIKVSHRTDFDPATLHAQLGLVEDQWGQFVEDATLLSETEVTPVMMGKLLKAVYGDKAITQAEDGTVTYKPVVERALKAVRQSPGATLPSARNTLWGVVNGVTFVSNHLAGRSDSSRMDSAWFGRGDKQNRTAFAAAVELAREAA